MNRILEPFPHVGGKAMKKLFITVAVMLLPITVLAAPVISIKQASEKEVIEKKGGKTVTKRVPATSVEPGQKLFFIIRYSNTGTSAAKNVVLENPIPKNALYVAGSAKGKGSSVTFSVDNGQNFAPADELRVRITDANGNQESVKAGPENYTNVRWTVAAIEAGARGQVSYAVTVK